MVEVGVEQGEGLLLGDPPADLLLDADVAGEPGERGERRISRARAGSP